MSAVVRKKLARARGTVDPVKFFLSSSLIITHNLVPVCHTVGVPKIVSPPPCDEGVADP